MDQAVSLPLLLFFGLTVLLTLFFLAKATQSKVVILGSIGWILLQSAVSLSGFYLNISTLPPHFALALFPPLAFVLGILFFPAGKRLADNMKLDWTILLHTVRIPVEITLFYLFLAHQVPALMTFEAGNIDILAGLTAPIIWWARRKGKLNNKLFLTWNAFCLVTLANVVARALLSAPFRFQRIAFDQPTVAVLYFPFVLLPAFIVPAVLFCHLATLRTLLVPTPASSAR
ncbi:hypothetical protein GRAN_2700 [Granulicella sibirica]|uniref:Uncharacterized protein n=2 Tax=Granulicella sibirica TaxID=2479048 RepID=A0A4Q0SXH3_9BACT|nr:hypothetical protein GRAN_2700 [Granulicella sibirica]